MPHAASRGLASVLPVALLAAGITLSACTAPADHDTLRVARLAEPVPAHRFAMPGGVATDYLLSPDGRKLAWSGREYGRALLYVRDNTTGEERRYRVPSGARRWTPSGRWLLIQSTDTSGRENSRILVLDTANAEGEVADLTPSHGVRAQVHGFAAGPPERVLVTHNRRDPRLFDLYEIDLATRAEKLVAQNPGDAVSVIVGAGGRFQGWVRSGEAARPVSEKTRPLAERRPELTRATPGSFRVLGRDDAYVYGLSDRGRDRVALVAAHPAFGWEKVLFEDPHADVTEVVMSTVTRAPLLAAAEPGYPSFEILDQALRRDLETLLREQGGGHFGLRILNRDAREDKLVVSVYTSSAARVYLVERAKARHVLLAGPPPGADSARDPVEPVRIRARDGRELPGYLRVPAGLEGRRPPMVLQVHGGPWQRSHWTGSDNPVPAEFLLSRGYAVLDVNFRGSTGYGREFLMAGVGEFAGRMQDDLVDALEWAVKRGVADPRRVAIMGWSYGGYAALVGLTFDPKRFACGISIAGPTELASLIENFPPYWQVDRSMWLDFVGNPAIERDRLDMTRRSPLTHAGALERPVLIVHGAQDVRVRVDQAERMVAALRRAGKPVRYLRVEDMGHNVGWWVHRLAILRETEAFLHDCLGGQAKRFDWLEPLAWAWGRASRLLGP